jgi:hypothetical protein
MPEPLSSALAIVSQGVDLLDKVGILGQLKNKPLSSPDLAAAKLARVLAELGRTYQVVDDSLVGFASLTFEDSNAQRDTLELLNKARGGHLEATMMEARAHCDEIWYVYERYLRGWFSRVLKSKQEEDELWDLFYRLGRADDCWVGMLETVAREMQQISDHMITLLERGDVDGARALRREVVGKFRTLQTQIGAGLVELQKLKREFSAITGGMDI